MNKIKPFFKGTHHEMQAIFKQSRCLLTISVGQQSHEGKWFQGTMQLIDKSFKECIVLIDDSLQRHTMALHANKQTRETFL